MEKTMKKTMRKIVTFLLIFPSLMSYADGVNLDTPSPSAVVVQKALASGVTFTTRQVEYQLVLGARAIAKSDNSVAAQSAHVSTSNLWSDEHGPYMVSIGSGGQSSNSSLSASGVSFKQLAFNPKTGNVAVVTGDIVVKIRPTYSAEAIAATYKINLVENFKDISFAWFQVNIGQDIFAMAQNLSGHPGVESSEIEVKEHFLQER
jgi:hypothetical protein